MCDADKIMYLNYSIDLLRTQIKMLEKLKHVDNKLYQIYVDKFKHLNLHLRYNTIKNLIIMQNTKIFYKKCFCAILMILTMICMLCVVGIDIIGILCALLSISLYILLFYFQNTYDSDTLIHYKKLSNNFIKDIVIFDILKI